MHDFLVMHHGNSHGIKWGGRTEKEMALGARFQKLRGGPYYQEGTEFPEGAKFWRATMFFCNHVISVATLL